MVKDNPRQVLLKGDDGSYRIESGEASGTVTPGDLLETTGTDTTGATTEYQYAPKSTADPGPVWVARAVRKTGHTVDDTYASGEYIELYPMEATDWFWGFVFDGANAGGAGTDLSANANLAYGDLVVPYAGAGESGAVRAYDSANDSPGDVIGIVRDAGGVDNSAGASKARVKIEVV